MKKTRSNRASTGRVYRFEPVGMDLWQGTPRVARGDLVRKCQPTGCPRNGTMGHCFIEDLDGNFLQLVLVNSLVPVSGGRP